MEYVVIKYSWIMNGFLLFVYKVSERKVCIVYCYGIYSMKVFMVDIYVFIIIWSFNGD